MPLSMNIYMHIYIKYVSNVEIFLTNNLKNKSSSVFSWGKYSAITSLKMN